MNDKTPTYLDGAREAWNFEREHWDGHGPSIRYDKATLALINALESDLARVTRERDELQRRQSIHDFLNPLQGCLEAAKAKVHEGLKASVRPSTREREAHYLGTLIDLRNLIEGNE